MAYYHKTNINKIPILFLRIKENVMVALKLPYKIYLFNI